MLWSAADTPLVVDSSGAAAQEILVSELDAEPVWVFVLE